MANRKYDFENERVKTIRSLFLKNGRVLSSSIITLFNKELWEFYRERKRDFPWRFEKDPYKIFVSEMMLQQTVTTTVIEKYKQFIARWPSFEALASAKQAEVLEVWKGLGYNRRALWIKQIAERVVNEYGGKLPSDPKILCSFKGIGKTTAGEICAFAYNLPVLIVNEVNIKRVFIFFFYYDVSSHSIGLKKIEKLLSKTLDKNNPREYYYALMDYGAALRSSYPNLLKKTRNYKKQKPFEGSIRQLRGKILEILIKSQALEEEVLIDNIKKDFGERYSLSVIRNTIQTLINEGFLKREGRKEGKREKITLSK